LFFLSFGQVVLLRTRHAARQALSAFRTGQVAGGQAPNFTCAACRKAFALFGDFFAHAVRDPTLCAAAVAAAVADAKAAAKVC
jgi:hypothetical protein